MTNRPSKLYFVGDRDANGQPLEWFGAVPGIREPIPARDLTPDDTAGFSEAQWEALDSPTGRRLYRRTEPAEEKRGANADLANTDAPSAESSS